MNFRSCDELYKSLNNGGDVEFEYNGKEYSITSIDEGISILEKYNYETEQVYLKSEDVGNYRIDNKLLKNIVTEIKVTLRSV